MVTVRTIAVVGFAFLWSAGCVHNKRALETVTTRAAFDFDCAPDELTLTVLDTEGARGLASQIGVEGCGEKSVYVYLASTDTWVANSAVTAEMAQAEADFAEERQRENERALQKPAIDSGSTYQRGDTE